MFRPKKAETSNFRADYANRVDFCEVFERDVKTLYLLAFLLTANHEDAERCLEATIDEVFNENGVVKAWARSWVRRCLIKEAIHTVFSRSARSDELRNRWYEELTEPRLNNMVNAVTGLEPLERFVFVTSILEGYPTRECALLLNCAPRSIAQLRVRASRRLAGADPLVTENQTRPSVGPSA